jgi:hypothetical protein
VQLPLLTIRNRAFCPTVERVNYNCILCERGIGMTTKDTINQRFSPEWDSQDTSALDPSVDHGLDPDRQLETGAVIGILGGVMVGAAAGGPVGAVVGGIAGGVAAGLGVAAVEHAERVHHEADAELSIHVDDLPPPLTVFTLPGYETAQTVTVAGTFNDWSATCHPLKLEDGKWVTRIKLPRDKQAYQFVVDGVRIPDPGSPYIEDASGNRDSIVVVADTSNVA